MTQHATGGSRVPNNTKLTWKEFCQRLHAAGIQDDDEIDKIDISWGRPEDIECRKDRDFGWQILL